MSREIMCNCDDYKEDMDLITFAAAMTFREYEVKYTGKPVAKDFLSK